MAMNASSVFNSSKPLDSSDTNSKKPSFFGNVSPGIRSVIFDPLVRGLEWGDISLRQWLENPDRSVDALENMRIFRQIVEIVRLAHSQGVVVHNVRPSCFVMSSFNRVSFIESDSCSDSGSGSESIEEGMIKNNSETMAMVEVGNDAEDGDEQKHSFPMKQILCMERNWYTSPEEIADSTCSFASDIYCLGVLLFELFCTFSSKEEKSISMSSLRHRVLTPNILLKWPKQATFCLWLLHPEPTSRPTIGDLIQSEFLNEAKESLEEHEALIDLHEQINEQELLHEFLMMEEQQKVNAENNLRRAISYLSSDMKDILNRQTLISTEENLTTTNISSVNVDKNEDSDNFGSRKRFRMHIGHQNEEIVFPKDSRVAKNFKKLEASYFSTRCKPSKKGGSWISPFLENWCKYLSFSKLEIKAELRQGEPLGSCNLVCSLSFDRNGEFFATAGINKKIKVFECESIVTKGHDIHYPLVEMASKSKLSSSCWNTYIKTQIASSNFEGVVQIWDVTRSQVVKEMREHERRVWSVDFSTADPTVLASGSDDGCVKLWSINQATSISTIKTNANVCCVQFPLNSGRFLAFGSADHRIYYYDLRSSKMPLCTISGHNKTVSYVKFVDSKNLVSASTDNTLKLWDLSTCASHVLDKPLQSFTGHINVKNFVGLSVSDGYIATGSESNEVFIYHKAFPMPTMSFKFNATDPFSGHEIDDSSHFVSALSWRGRSSTLVAANSTGNIKILEMV